MQPEPDHQTDHAFYNTLGVVFAALITLAATMSIILPPADPDPVQLTELTEIAARR